MFILTILFQVMIIQRGDLFDVMCAFQINELIYTCLYL